MSSISEFAVGTTESWSIETLKKLLRVREDVVLVDNTLGIAD